MSQENDQINTQLVDALDHNRGMLTRAIQAIQIENLHEFQASANGFATDYLDKQAHMVSLLGHSTLAERMSDDDVTVMLNRCLHLVDAMFPEERIWHVHEWMQSRVLVGSVDVIFFWVDGVDEDEPGRLVYLIFGPSDETNLNETLDLLKSAEEEDNDVWLTRNGEGVALATSPRNEDDTPF